MTDHLEFQKIVDQAPVLLWITDAQDRPIYLSPGWFEYTGQAPTLSIYDGWLSAVHPEDQQKSEDAFHAATARREPYTAEYRLRRADGAWRWIRDTGQPHYAGNGDYLGYVGTVLDIHEQRIGESALMASEQRYHELFNAIDEGVCIIEMLYDKFGKPMDYRFLEVNPAFETHTGIKDAQGKRMREIAPAHEQHWFDIYGNVARSGEAVRFQHKAQALDARYFDVNAFPIGRPDQNRVAVLFSDISQRVRAEEALRQSESFSRSLMQASADSVVILDRSGNLLFANEIAQCELRLESLADNIGRDWIASWPPHMQAQGREMLGEALAGRASRMQTLCTIQIDPEKWWDVQFSPVFDALRQVTRVLVVARDITAEKNSERALVEAKQAAEAANLAKSEFLANMSHEIRTPIGVVTGLTTILLKSRPLTVKQEEFLQTMKASSETLLALINDMLDVSKIEARSFELERTTFSLADIATDLARALRFKADEKHLAFTADDAGVNGKTYLGDPTRVRQIILNLCSNAIKFTETGSVHLALSSAAGAKPECDEVTITVTDTGIGIPEEKMGHVFEKFAQADNSIVRKYGGTGLGLAITKSLVDLMGGTIAASSTPGQGSTFRVTLTFPRAEQERTRANDNHVPRPALKPSRRRVLLVEDYYPNTLVAGTFLEEFGFDYDTASTGLEAVSKFQSGHYDAVLMDVRMPGMDGYQAVEAIRRFEAENGKGKVRIIGLTAHASANDRDKCLAAGMDDYLSKPFAQDQLHQKLTG